MLWWWFGSSSSSSNSLVQHAGQFVKALGVQQLAYLDPTLKVANDRTGHRDGRADVLGQVPGTFGREHAHGIVEPTAG